MQTWWVAKNGAQTSDSLGVDDHAGAHQKLFDHGGQADVKDIMQDSTVGSEAVPQTEPQVAALFHDRPEGHQEGDELADAGGKGCTGNAHFGEAQVAVDQQPVADDVDHVGDDVIDHGGAGIADAAQGGGDGAGQGHGDETDHLNAQIGNGGTKSLGVGGAGEDDQRFGEDVAQNRRDRRKDEGHQQRLTQDQIGLFLVSGAFRAGDQGSGTGVQGHEQSHQQEFGLGGQTDGGQRPGSQGTDHHHVHHRSQLGQHQLDERGPCDADYIAVQLFVGNALGQLFRDLAVIIRRIGVAEGQIIEGCAQSFG